MPWIMSRATPCVTTTPFATIWKTTTALSLQVKSRDGLTPMLSTIVPKEGNPRPRGTALRTLVNGELRQQGTTANLIFQRALPQSPT
ncbi:fumarylacetoacetate hydrolase family protein [Shigella flexneri]